MYLTRTDFYNLQLGQKIYRSYIEINGEIITDITNYNIEYTVVKKEKINSFIRITFKHFKRNKVYYRSITINGQVNIDGSINHRIKNIKHKYKYSFQNPLTRIK